MRQVSELESIGDSCYKAARAIDRSHLVKPLTDEQIANIGSVMDLCEEALTQMNVVMANPREENDIRESFRIENELNAVCRRLKSDNITAMNEHRYDYPTGTVYADIISELEKLGDYVVNVVEARFGV